jgi:hypothetical protein
VAPLAVSTGIQIAYVVALVVVIYAGPISVAELKDQRFLPSFGWWTFGVTWWIGAFRLARPESWWLVTSTAHARWPGPKIFTSKTNGADGR